MNNTIVLVTGGFDPIHSGHIAYFKAAKKLGDQLVVGVNSDAWLTRKKGKPFMHFEERVAIIKELACVDEVLAFNDDDGTACAAIFQLLATKGSSWSVLFANGGDRTSVSTPEYNTFKNRTDVAFAFGVGGSEKKNSSSWILKEWSQPTIERAWGRYTILDSGNGWSTKKLSFDVGKSLSDQRHSKRSEHWHIVEGEIAMQLEYANGIRVLEKLKSGDSIDIPANTWHKAINVGTTTAKVVEVWLGRDLTEDDIERRD